VFALEGLRLASGDIVETAASTFAQIELSDRSVLELGPGTRVMMSAAARGKQAQTVYVLDGWGKVTNPKADPPGASGLEVRAPLFEIAATPSVIVFQSASAEVTMFVERGEIRLAERNPAAVVSLQAGDYYRRKAASRGAVNSPDARTLVAQMPRHFRDSLPSRLEKFRGREVKPKDAPAFSYADVEKWLKAEPAIRRPLMQRWRVKARDSAFRSALIANLSAHPEWDPILFPEKYLPKEPPTDPAKSAPAGQPPLPPAR
jgi:hypothetical protein